MQRLVQRLQALDEPFPTRYSIFLLAPLADSGNVTRIDVPSPGAAMISKVPPSDSTRNRMPVSPWAERGCVAISNPMPSSRTFKCTWPSFAPSEYQVRLVARLEPKPTSPDTGPCTADRPSKRRASHSSGFGNHLVTGRAHTDDFTEYHEVGNFVTEPS